MEVDLVVASRTRTTPSRYEKPIPGTRYSRLDLLDPDDRPTTYPMPVHRVRMERGRPLDARESRSLEQKTRWCLCCDTPLPPRGRSPLCKGHRDEHTSLRRRRNLLIGGGTIPLRRADVEPVHQRMDRLEAEMGRLMTAYHAGRDIRGEIGPVLQAAAGLIDSLRLKWPDTRDVTDALGDSSPAPRSGRRISR